jgi:tetratricopeptide (TPR) repeat protein
LTDLFGSQTKNYHQLDLFFEDSIKELKGTKKDNAQSVYYQIELYYGLANIYFRKKNLEQSLSYLMQMEQQMLRLDQKYFSHWQARFCNLKALNLNFEGQSEAAENLLSAVLNKKNLFEKEEALLKLTLAMVCFQQGELEQVKTLINTLNRTDQWYLSKMGNEWLFNLKAIEILLHMDLGNDQLAESRLLSFQRKLPKAIKADKGNPLWPFIKLVKSILFNNSVVRTEEFVEKVERTIPWKGRNEDIFNICFYGWLKAKMINRPVYPTTLEIMKSL